MSDIVLVGLLTVAIGIGYILGRRKRRSSRRDNPTWELNKSYFQGLNYLLNEQPDKAVDAFVESLDVNTDTLETHLALGKLMRKQGQVDRAIRIHQNVLARPRLDAADQHQVHLELARDFMAAGLLDRAEMLLKEVIGESGELRSIAQRYLMDIYQDESEWSDAIKTAESLSQSKYVRSNVQEKRSLSRMIAQFYCELAAESNQKNDIDKARKLLAKATAIDKGCVRAAISLAILENEKGRHKQAAKSLVRVVEQNPLYIPECLPELLKAYLGQDAKSGFGDFATYFEDLNTKHPSAASTLFYVEKLMEQHEQADSDEQQTESYRSHAATYLSNFLQSNPSFAGLNKLISLQIPSLEGEVGEQAEVLHSLTSELVKRRMVYKCNHCGFAGRQLHWRCPSCKRWDEMDRMRGAGAE